MEWLKYYIKILINLPEFLFYEAIDLFVYYRDKLYNEFYGWGLHLYTGKFGAGKTCSMVHDAYLLAKRYPQLNILTNLSLTNFPEHTNIIPLNSPRDILNAPVNTLVLIDEIGTIFNSRDYAKSKESVPKILFQHLCQCRKRKMQIFATSQRWNFVDKQLRDITATVNVCDCFFSHPFCRLNTVKTYDAVEYDMAYTNPLLPVTLLETSVFVQTNKYRSLYDTTDMVDNMLKMDYISDEEILANRGEQPLNTASVDNGRDKRNYNKNKKIR